jgi:hypothetical protein
MLWHWKNDPAGLPDDDHTRCIAAPGVRELLYCGRLFEMTTVASSRVPASARTSVTGRRALLQMEHVSKGPARGLVARYWRSRPFDSRSLGGVAQYAAGLDLLATVATELAGAGSGMPGAPTGCRTPPRSLLRPVP